MLYWRYSWFGELINGEGWECSGINWDFRRNVDNVILNELCLTRFGPSDDFNRSRLFSRELYRKKSRDHRVAVNSGRVPCVSRTRRHGHQYFQFYDLNSYHELPLHRGLFWNIHRRNDSNRFNRGLYQTGQFI